MIHFLTLTGTTPTKSLKPLGEVFVAIVSYIWPIYLYIRTSFRSFGDGLVCQAPFKIGGVLLTIFVYSYVVQHVPGSNVVCSSAYVQGEFELFSLLVFGYLLLMSVLRATRITDFLSDVSHRSSWVWPVRYIDGALAVIVEFITIPWILEGFREVFQLPGSKVIDWGLRVSSDIISVPLGSFAGNWLNAGKSVLESEISQFTGGHNYYCAGDVYQGRWFFAMVIAILLLPAVFIISFEPLLGTTYFADSGNDQAPEKCEKCDGDGYFGPWHPLLAGAQCPECRGSGDTANKGTNRPFAPLMWAIFMSIPIFLAWLLCDFIVSVIRMATGVLTICRLT